MLPANQKPANQTWDEIKVPKEEKLQSLRSIANQNRGDWTVIFGQCIGRFYETIESMGRGSGVCREITNKWLTQDLDRKDGMWGGKYFELRRPPSSIPTTEVASIPMADLASGRAPQFRLRRMIRSQRTDDKTGRWMQRRQLVHVCRGKFDHDTHGLGLDTSARVMILLRVLLTERFAYTGGFTYRAALDLWSRGVGHSVGMIVHPNGIVPRIKFFDSNTGEWTFETLDGLLNWIPYWYKYLLGQCISKFAIRTYRYTDQWMWCTCMFKYTNSV